MQDPKPNKPIFKRPLFWVVIVVFLLLVGGCSARCGNHQSTQSSTDSSSVATTSTAQSSAEQDHAGQVQTPLSSFKAAGENYEDVQTQFEKAGFTNVSAQGQGDMVTGWLTDEGDVDKVSIDGETSFDEGDWCDPDAKVVIRYHSYPEKDSDSASSSSSKESKSASKSASKSSGSGKVSAKFKKTMDDYEAFVDKYVKFMKKYKKSGGSDMSMMTEYADYLSRYNKLTEEIEDIDEDELSVADAAYYSKVMARVSSKLLKVT